MTMRIGWTGSKRRFGPCPNGSGAHSVLAILDFYRRPAEPVGGSPVPGAHFHAAVAQTGSEIPHITVELINKYVSDMKLAGLLLEEGR